MREQIKLLPPKGGRSHDDRLFVNAVLFHAKTGLPWKDLPERFGKWKSVYQRYNRWSKPGIWEKIFELTADPEPMVVVVDSTSVRANQVAAGQKKPRPGQPLYESFTWWTDL